MTLLHLDEIHLQPNRHRQIFGPQEISDLADSIAKVGLIHAPVVRSVDGLTYLIAGERRLRAIRQLYETKREYSYGGQIVTSGHIPIVNIANLPEHEARLIELEENIRRVDLSWQERVRAVAALEEMKKLLNPDWSRSDTKDELGLENVTSVSDKILLSENLHRPSVASAPSERQAVKALHNELRVEFEAALGRKVGLERPKSVHVLQQADFAEGMNGLADESIDVFLTDPPYGIGADGFRANMTILHKYEDDPNWVKKNLPLLFALARQKAKRDAHLYLFCDVQKFMENRYEAELQGWTVWPRPLIWVKNIQMNHNPEYGPGRLYECILFARKGERKVRTVRPDVIYHPIEKETHAAQKPVGLYLDLLERSALPGDVVCDPFCGSGTIFPAANKLSLTAIGFDIDPSAVGQASLRLEEKPK